MAESGPSRLLMRSILDCDAVNCLEAIDRGADVNEVGPRLYYNHEYIICPLAYAFLMDRPFDSMRPLVDAMMSAGAKIDGPAINQSYDSPMAIAATASVNPWFDWLLDNGANPLVYRGYEGGKGVAMHKIWSAAAVSRDPIGRISKLTSLGLDVNVVWDYSGETILHTHGAEYAAENPAFLEELFVHGADPFLKSVHEQTPMQLYASIPSFVAAYDNARRRLAAANIASSAEIHGAPSPRRPLL